MCTYTMGVVHYVHAQAVQCYTMSTIRDEIWLYTAVLTAYSETQLL